MRLLIPLAILAAAAAVLMTTPADVKIAGLDHSAVAAAAGLSAMLCYLIAGARPSALARMATSLAIWLLLFAGLAGIYAYRFDAGEFIGRMTAELLPAEAQVGQGGAVIIGRRLGGGFAAAARVNGARTSLLFDTGASMVVLSAADARRAGINPAGLAYNVPVTTANGSALAAQVRLDEVAVGPIVMRRVPALVAKPGALEESLLGMSFLERLKSFSVERDKLILTAK